MEIFDVPELVYYTYLWPLLDWEDILRMRRVCKRAKDDISKYLRSNPKRVPELEINEDDKTLDLFLKMDIPITKLFLNNKKSGTNFYKKWRSSRMEFLDLHGEKITSLRVDQFNLWPAGAEEKFLKRLVNLEVLLVNTLLQPAVFEILGTNTVDFVHSNPFPSPKLYRKLKVLDLGIEKSWETAYAPTYACLYTKVYRLMLELWCPNVESVAFPFICDGPSWVAFLEEMDAMDQMGNALNALLALTTNTIEHAATDPELGPKKLRKISFQHFFYGDQSSETNRDTESIASMVFMQFATVCSKAGIVLEKVNAGWFFGARAEDFGGYFSDCIVSMVNVHPCVVDVIRLNNLETLEIFTSRTCVSSLGKRIGDRPAWPALKNLKVTVDSSALDEQARDTRRVFGRLLTHFYESQPISDLFKFLFRTGFPQIKDLTIDIQKDWKPSQTEVQLMVKSCPNVKKLSLTNWTGTNKALTHIWAGMTKLEEVKLDRCLALGNVAFVGENVEDPIFLRLTKLRKVSLLGIDKMPKISDTLFRLVISRMEISHLILSSDKPVSTLTESGIRSLLGGAFADSIVKFPFKGWSLSDCTGLRWMRLSQEFRSYNLV